MQTRGTFLFGGPMQKNSPAPKPAAKATPPTKKPNYKPATKAASSVPKSKPATNVKTIALEENTSVRVRKIENGYVTSRETYDKKKGYKTSEVFSESSPVISTGNKKK